GKYVQGGYRQKQRVIGIVNDVAESFLTGALPPTRYYVAQQVPWWGSNASFVIRTAREADAQGLIDQGRQTVNRVAPDFAIQEATTMSRVFDRAVGPARQIMSLLTLLSGLALILGAVGIYGVIAHFAARRKRDWAIRLALGLPSWRVVTQIVRGGSSLILIGVVIGGIGTIALARLLTSFLYGVSTLDPIAFIAASLLMIATGLVAAYVPARRAGTTAPAMVLREQ
ncbi:MAG: FtsX-like permease family protein, partial [Gemmatimonadaceae bacterium]